MKAIQYHGNKDIRLEEIPLPNIENTEVLIKIDYCGLCATDIEEYLYGPNSIKKTPMTPGHELVGTVENIGKSVTNITPGQRVVIDGIISCQKCLACTKELNNQCTERGTVGFSYNGGFAEYLIWPAEQAFSLPDSVSTESAALIEPASVACHAIELAKIQPNETVCIIGAGTLGLLAAQIAKIKTSKVIAIDTREISLQLAKNLGITQTIDVKNKDMHEELKTLTAGKMPEVIIETAGGPTALKSSIENVKTGGRIIMVAVQGQDLKVPVDTIVNKELQLIGTGGYRTHNVKEAINLLEKKQLITDCLISGYINLEEVISDGYNKMMSKEKNIFRLLVDPHNKHQTLNK